MKLELGIVLILLGVILVSPVSNMLQLTGPQSSVYWNYPAGSPTNPVQVIADANSIPCIMVYTPDETNYTIAYNSINILAGTPWPINGSLQISAGTFSATTKLLLMGATKMQVGWLYSFGLGSDWVTSVPWTQGQTVPVGSTVVAAWYNPNLYFLCTPGSLYQALQPGVVYTFSWTVNVPLISGLSTTGYGKKYYTIQGVWTMNGNPLSSVAVNVSSSTVNFAFAPTVGAVNISTVYVQISMRGSLVPTTITLSQSGTIYAGSYSLPNLGVYDLSCYFSDIQGTVYGSLSSVIVYGSYAESGWAMNMTPLRLGGFGSVGVGVTLAVWGRKGKRKK